MSTHHAFTNILRRVEPGPFLTLAISLAVAAGLTGPAGAKPAAEGFWTRDSAGRVTHKPGGGQAVVLCMQGRKVVMEVHADETRGLTHKTRFFNVPDRGTDKRQVVFDADRGRIPESLGNR